MHIGLVSETYPPEVNGVALTVESYARGLRALGHRVSVARPRQAGEQAANSDELLLPGAPIPAYPGLRFGLPARSRLHRQWQQDRPDAIYIATEGPLGWSALRCARQLGIPVASGFHTRFDDYLRRYGWPWLAPWAMAWMRRFHNLADATLVPTQALADELAGHGFLRLQTLGRAVDGALFHPGRRDLSLRRGWQVDPSALLVIHVGRIAAEKNLELLLRSFRRLQQQVPSAQLMLVGDGPERAPLQAAHPDLIFAGTQRGEALARHFASADLFLFPSLSETFGNVTLEAMASGVATVAFRYGAAAEHLRDVCSGALPLPGDADGFIAAACTLAVDPDRRRRYARLARAAIESSRPRAICQRLADLLAHLSKEDRQHEPITVA